MNTLLGKLFLICALCTFGNVGLAQSKSELQAKKKELTEKLQLTSELISQNVKDKKGKEGEIQVLQSQIKLREKLINVLQQQVDKIQVRIDSTQHAKDSLDQNLAVLKMEYEKLVRYAYRNRSSYQRMVFVFSAASFNQAYNRVRYLQQVSAFRKRHAQEIERVQGEVQEQLAALTQQKDEKEILLISQQQERDRLGIDKERKKYSITELSKEQHRLKGKLTQVERKKKKIEKAISDIIAEEIKAERARQKKTGKGYSITPEAKAMGVSFEQNKGKLPWPVEKGVITGHFGKQPHPVLGGITIENNGIDITTHKEAAARAVFNGRVSNILVIPGSGKVIVITHGTYRTIYTNLKEAFVQKGETVSTKQAIGKVLPDPTGTKSEAHIEIWSITKSGVKKLDPEIWLYQH
ncbi:MAG: septal ring factor EnvC (AmiA/AmiB activator) [Sphingobacteriales bacterium]|jgi:septal ring factor EnvC (AmiA/AmiB activator)